MQNYQEDFYKSHTETENTEERNCTRSRKKQARTFGIRQTAALCLGAAVLGGTVVGVYQTNHMQAMYLASGTAAEDTSNFLTEMAWDGSQSVNLAEQVDAAGSVDSIQKVDTQNTTSTTPAGSVSTGGSGSSSVIGGMDVSNIAVSALPSVVSITTISVQEVQQFYSRFGRNGQGPSTLQQVSSCGSGVIVAKTDNALYMVTNYHVIEDANTISVSFGDGTVCGAELCGTDADLDLAVVKVSLDALSADTLNQISVVSIGDSNALRVGEQVVAIGNALGYGQSVTTGIVSALNRAITTGTDSSGNTQSSTYIQTDAAINPGNSGGALLNMSGELIGINTAKASSTEIEGMGYAIPISDVWETIQALMVQTPSNIGATVQTSTYVLPGQNWWRR